ncbi:MAG: transcriptional regulator NrdR [bacterium]
MKCPHCSHAESRVLESRELDDGSVIRRRRECSLCHVRFTTYERIEQPRVLVVKKSGERVLFDRDKLARGIYRACEKRPIEAHQIEELIGGIERQVYGLGESEVDSQLIGEMTMESLGALDEVAYVRFASVYRSFTSAANFQQEIDQLKQSQSNKE